VLYYSTFANYEVDDDEMNDKLYKIRDDANRPIAKDVRKFVKEQRNTIKALTDAGNIEKCNWGYDPSLGMELVMPYLSKARESATLLIADAYIKADDRLYKKAFESCLTSSKMACHMGDDTLVSYLVAIAIDSLSIQTIRDILCKDMHPSRFKWLAGEIEGVDARFPKGKAAVMNDYMMFKSSIENYDKFKILASVYSEDFGDPNRVAELTSSEDKFNKNAGYYEKYMLQVSKAFEMPYYEGAKRLEELEADIEKTISMEALFAKVFAPATDRILLLQHRHQAQRNGLITAINIHIAYSETGKLPESLDAGWPVDPFSGKPFVYEKTEEGFVLKCLDEDLPGRERRKEYYEYEFKL